MENKKLKISLLILSIIIVAIIICVYVSCNVLTVSQYTIYSDKLPKEFDGYKIVQISDLHNKYYGKDGNELLKEIDKISPNIVVMTGDMVNSKDEDYTIFFDIVHNISKKYDTYYIFVNHEEDLSQENKDKIIDKLGLYDVHVFVNNKESIYINDQKINIYGLSRQLKTDNDNEIENIYVLKGLLKDVNIREYNILLAHNPLYFEEYAKYNVDLVLSGHIHGGIIRLPIIGGLLSPEQSFMPQYSKGEYNLENSKMIVNAGIGIGRLPIRLFNPLDISLIELKCSD